MTVAEKPKEFVRYTIDTNTLARLRVLSGQKPVARYLRELSLILTQDSPPSMDDLQGGESLTPIRKQLSELKSDMESIKADIQELAENFTGLDKTWHKSFVKHEKDLLLMVNYCNALGSAIEKLHPDYKGVGKTIRDAGLELTKKQWSEKMARGAYGDVGEA